MHYKLFFSFLLVTNFLFAQKSKTNFFEADNKNIQYIGRMDFTNSKLPRFWQPGVYINIKFEGSTCNIILNDEVLWGKNQNYFEIVLDGKATRLQTKSKTDTINVGNNLSKGVHYLTIVKNTEANIGYLEFVGISCEKLLVPNPKPNRKIEFIGNSITCAAGSDMAVIPCGRGMWHDQHNAYLSYGANTARALNAQYHLSAVSGIGLMHSCCNMNIVMPPVFDKVSMRNDTIAWNFKNYQPDVVTICLGQNDGVQDSTAFCDNYILFLKQLRSHYPKANFVCLSSPMADDTLRIFMKKTITAIIKKMSDKKLTSYFFSKQFHNGCDGHPDLKEHEEIGDELTQYLRKKMKW
jgi:Carbohydrate esterase 2 N-terminal/GDSL-like Lipase/Acylhydrolase family